MYEITRKMYKAKQIPKHFKILNISDEPIEDLASDKLLNFRTCKSSV